MFLPATARWPESKPYHTWHDRYQRHLSHGGSGKPMAVSLLNKTYRVKTNLPGQRWGAKAGTSTFVTRFS